MSLCSGAVLEDAGYVSATLILLLFILLGIMFDIIGVAVTAANPKPFNSMAAHRVKGAKEALYLIRNAEKVASFCNDVVGDICVMDLFKNQCEFLLYLPRCSTDSTFAVR